MSDPLTDSELDEMLSRATDGRDHEWGWYVDDVPRLVLAVRQLRRVMAEDHAYFWANR